MKALNIATFQKKSINNRHSNTIEKANKRANWLLKRIVLHIIWGVINLAALIYFSTIITGTPWEFFFLAFGIIYCTAYWIIASKIFDKLIGDEIENIYK